MIYDVRKEMKLKRAGTGSQFVLMNISQSVWSLHLMSHSAQFVLCHTATDIRKMKGVSDSKVAAWQVWGFLLLLEWNDMSQGCYLWCEA